MTESINNILQINRTGMLARMMDLDVVSNNIANLNTHGYKSTRSNFQELLNAQGYNGTQLRSTQRFMTQGSINTTGRNLDLVISGGGFLGVKLPDGRVAYTRDGTFQQDDNHQIVNSNGFPLVWDGQIPDDATGISINQDGTVMVQQAGTWNQAGTIQVYRFANTNGLQNYGDSLLLENDVSGAAQAGAAGSEGYGKIVSGGLENSNVDMASELTQMVILQRSYQMSLKAFQSTDDMLALAIAMRK